MKVLLLIGLIIRINLFMLFLLLIDLVPGVKTSTRSYKEADLHNNDDGPSDVFCKHTHQIDVEDAVNDREPDGPVDSPR